MLHRLSTLHGFTLSGPDHKIGRVRDVYFDDRFWAARYLTIDTGSWLTGRQTLLSPYAIASVDPHAREVITNLTRAQIEAGPPLDADRPVSRQFEDAYYSYYGWPAYWGGPYMWGASPYPSMSRTEWRAAARKDTHWDPHLRSMDEVRGYDILATDGGVGHVADALIDYDGWAIRYLVIDTKNWWPGMHVLLGPRWIADINWPQRNVLVTLTREQIKNAPPYSEDEPVTREYEQRLHDYYGQPIYWAEGVAHAHSE